jgi:hypothetical protein
MRPETKSLLQAGMNKLFEAGGLYEAVIYADKAAAVRAKAKTLMDEMLGLVEDEINTAVVEEAERHTGYPGN